MGIAPSEFWKMTRAEQLLAIEGWAECEEKRQKERIAQAWHTANLVGHMFSGKMPKLDKYLKDIFSTKPKPKTSTAEIKAAAEAHGIQGPW